MRHPNPGWWVATGTRMIGPVSRPDASSINPVPWSRRLGHDQGQLRSSVTGFLAIGGQRPVDGEGRFLHGGDSAAQAALALDNLTAVLHAAGMEMADLVHLRVFATSRAALLDAQLAVSEHLAAASVTTPVTYLEVAGLAVPGMEVEVEGLAVRTGTTDEGRTT